MQPYLKVAFHTLGCKLNFAETSSIAQTLLAQGYARVNLEEQPDIFVINTCSVTENANKECSYWVRKAQRINPKIKVAIIGCYAQLKPLEIAKIEGVTWVLGAAEKFQLPKYFEEHLWSENLENSLDKSTTQIVNVGSIKEVKDFVPSYSLGERTRSFLKVQDGCDYFCSFCTIPLARGKSRSSSVETTFEKAKELAKKGVQEIVLTGVNIGDFGAGTSENFLDLLKKLVTLSDIKRWRISSIEPNLLTTEILDFLVTKSQFMPHFHIPLQSGSDVILQKMRRKYDTNLYREKILAVKERFPDAAIGIDVIVGFPFETETEFLKTSNFLSDLDFSYLHVFTYSERENTTAIKWENEAVPIEERKKRNKILQLLSQKKKRNFYQLYQNSVRSVLFENQEENGQMLGFTDNYIQVIAPFDLEKIGKIIPVQLQTLDLEDRMTGAFCS